MGVMMVSISLVLAVHENIFMGTGFLKEALISSVDFFRSYFILRHRSERRILVSNRLLISSGSKSRKGAVRFRLGVF